MRQFDTPASTDNLEAEHLKRLLDVGRGLVSKHDLESVLEQVLEAARDLTGSRYAALGILDDEKRELARFLTLGIDDELRRRIGPLPRGYGLLGELIRSPKPLRLRSISEHPRSYGFPAEHPHMETFLGTPVTIRGEVYREPLPDREGIGRGVFGARRGAGWSSWRSGRRSRLKTRAPTPAAKTAATSSSERCVASRRPSL